MNDKRCVDFAEQKVKLKILVIHNRYLEQGGEDTVLSDEKEMLESYGHEIILYSRNNSELKEYSAFAKMRFVLQDSCWSKSVYNEVQNIIEKHKPDIAHIHNTFLMITPSVYDACYDKKIPVVQTFHNYRFLCSNGLFFRENKPCEDCLVKGNFQSIKHKCWRKSFFASAIMARVLKQFKGYQLFNKKINAGIVLSEFSRDKFVYAGFDSHKLFVKPNFVDLKNIRLTSEKGEDAIFVGRLVDYKGIECLMDAFRMHPKIRLNIIGDGPLMRAIESQIANMDHVNFLGRLSYQKTLEAIKKSAFLIFPSTCYETFGRVIIEAFACGVPVIASDAGAAKELVQDGYTGYLFESGNSDDLFAKINLFMQNKILMRKMRIHCRQEYEKKYSLSRNYEILLNVYQKAMELNS